MYQGFEMFRWILIVWTLFLTSEINAENNVVVCSYNGQLEKDRIANYNYTLDSFDISKCTYLIYGNPKLEKVKNEWKIQPKDGDMEFETVKETALKQNPQLKILPVIDVDPRRTLPRNTDEAKIAATNIKASIEQMQFQGVTIWSQSLEKREKEFMTTFLKVLRDEFEQNLNIIYIVSADYMKTVPMDAIKSYVDFIYLNIFVDPMKEKSTKPRCPISSNNGKGLTIESTVNYILERNVTESKILMPLPFNGVPFVVKSNSKGVFGEKTGRNQNFKGDYLKSKTEFMFSEICLLNKTNEWKRHWDNSSRTPLLTQGKNVISYDDMESLKEKITYAKNKSLGGFIIDRVQYDDLHGDCGEGNNPLMRGVIEAIEQTVSDVPVAPEATR